MPALLIWMIQVQSLMWKCIWWFWRMNKLYMFKAMLYLFISVVAISQLLRHELLSVSCSECCSKSSIAVCRALQTFLGFSVCICLLHILYYVCGCLAGHLYRMEGDPSSSSSKTLGSTGVLCWHCIWVSLSEEKDGDRVAQGCVASLEWEWV